MFIPKRVYQYSTTLVSAVANAATFTTDYPTGTSQLTFNAGNYKEGSARFVVGANDAWPESSSAGLAVTTFGASTITFTNNTGATIAAGTVVQISLEVWGGNPVFLNFHLDLASITTAADVITEIRPGIEGYITYMEFVADKPVTTASKLLTLNAEIDTTNVTGGTVALTSAALTPKGAVVAASRMTAANRLERESKLSIEASAVTAFAEGTGNLIIKIQPDADDAGL